MSTLLPLGGIVTTLVAPDGIVVSPLGPPSNVVTAPIPPGAQLGETVGIDRIELAGARVVELLGPIIIVTTLPFGRVVATPVPQTVEPCKELAVLFGAA